MIGDGMGSIVYLSLFFQKGAYLLMGFNTLLTATWYEPSLHKKDPFNSGRTPALNKIAMLYRLKV